MGAAASGVVTWVGRNGKRMAVAVLGVALIVAGLPLVVLPGPAFLFFAAGLAVLATEFAWAERALVVCRRRATQAGDLVRRRGRDRARCSSGA